ncbi:hypothetical protein KKC94_05460 [Patescibacteria group bacterium]|nr:hypothetical protein [Patescibacteria group bacterium]
MKLDEKLTQIGLKMKNLVVVDLSFPEMKFPAFKSAYEQRYVHLLHRKTSAVKIAGGIASQGKIVLVFGVDNGEVNLSDSTLNVKVVKRDKSAHWDNLERDLKEFGASVLLIPSED